MDTTPHRGTSLEVLAPYLPFGIELQHLEWGGRHVLTGLVKGQHAEGTAQAKGAGDVRLGYVLPVLKGFSALVTPLEDGSVPAKEVLLLIDKPRYQHLFKSYIKRLFIEEGALMMEVDGAAFEKETYTKLACLKSHIWGSEMKATVADYLRSKHFAVNLQPHQFIEK